MRDVQREIIQTEWLDPPGSLSLGIDEVHVWRATLEMQQSQSAFMKSILSDDELSRSVKLHFQKDRDHFVAARGLLRVILGAYLDIGPKELRFSYGPFGKPFLAEGTPGKRIRFNVSHSQGLALLAVAHDREIGVDLEHLLPYHLVRDIAEQFFSRQEVEVLNALPEHLRPKMFFTLWTRKEAYIKALGEGFSADTGCIDFLLRRNCAGVSKTDGGCSNGKPWQLEDLAVSPDFAAAIAVAGHGWRLKCLRSHNDFDVAALRSS